MCRNLAQMLSLDNEPATRLLRACGVDERIIRGGSDYDRFAAFAAVIPLCDGHILANRMQADLRSATGLTVPLCTHTAPMFWRRWVDMYWYGKQAFVPDVVPCTACTPLSAMRLTASDVIALPDPVDTAKASADLATFTHLLQKALPVKGYATFRLPADYGFRRPDPYHVAEALRISDRDLLLTQALRVWGEAACSHDVILLLMGGAPDVVLDVLAYLFDHDRLPHLTWLPDDPAHAAWISGIYPTVGTGYVLPAESLPSEEREARFAYAAVAPIGRAVIYMP